MSTNWPPYGSMPAPFGGLNAQQQASQQHAFQQSQAPLPFEQPGLASPFYPPALAAYPQPYNINYQAYGQNAPQLQYPQQLSQQQPYQAQYQAQQPLQNQHWTNINAVNDWRGSTHAGPPRQNDGQTPQTFPPSRQDNQEADENIRKQKNAEEIFRSEPDFNTALRTIRDLARQFPKDFPRFDTPPTFDKGSFRPPRPAPPDSVAQNAPLAQPVPPNRSSPDRGGPPPDVGVRDQGSERMDIEIEDGEVSEGGQLAQGHGAGASTHGETHSDSQAQPMPQKQTAELPPTQPTTPAGPIPTTTMFSGTANPPASDIGRDLAARREEARQFIRLLHKNNISFSALANEGLDTGRLQDLYRSAGLPFDATPERAGPQASNGAASAPSTNAMAAPTTAVPAADPRAQYIARLQAAKRAKTGPTAAPPKETAPTPPAAQLPPKPAVDAPEVDPEIRARTTEIIRQRIKELEHFKKLGKASSYLLGGASSTETPAAQASQEASLSSPILPSARSDNPTLPQGAAPATYSTIPGLFMNTPSAVPPNATQASGRDNVPNGPPESESAAQSSPVNAKSQENAKPSDNPAPEPSRVDASDVENEGSEMDLSDGNSVNRLAESPSSTNRPKPESRPAAVTHSLPPRPPSTLPGLATSTVAITQTFGSQAGAQQMDDKQQALLRAKAAAKSRLREVREEREKKALAARASQQPSNVASPAPPPETSNSRSGTPLVKAVQPSDVARGSRKRRREEIESDLPLLDADYATNAARIAQLTKELEALAAHNAKIEQDRERLKRELEDLGIDTEGLPHAELQAKMDEIDRGREAGLDNGIKHSSFPTDMDALPHNQAQASTKSPTQTLGQIQKANVQHAATEPGETAPAQSLAIPGLGSSFVSQHRNVPQALPKDMASAADVVSEPAGSASAAAPPTRQSPPTLSATETNGGPVQGTHPTPGDDDEDDFYSPTPANDEQAATAPAVQRAISLSEEGEIAMSESEGEYEPEEPAPVPQYSATRPGVEEHAAGPSTFGQGPAASSSASSTASSSDSDSMHGSDDSDGRDVQDSDADEEAMDISSSGSSASSPASLPDQESPDVAKLEQAHGSTGASAADFGAESAAVTTAAANGQESNQGEDTSVPFVPYDSPLKFFKSFRFHPHYADFVRTGYNSLTFSHSIDPFQPVCPTDLSGTDCTDPYCPYQHFRSMSLDGETLLVQLGTANPGKTDAEKKRWIEGMQGLLKDIRTRNVQGFEKVAEEIGKFRREFLGSDDRVLGI